MVEFHNCVIWGKTAETASAFLEKGALVLVEGRLATRTWEDKDGMTRKVTEIIVENVQFGPRTSAEKPTKQQVEQPKTTATDDGPVIDLDDEDAEAPGRGFEQVMGDEEEPPF
jgi:single-strand DNA-binding protein